MIFRCFPLLFTYYIRDPQGNVLAVYERAISEEQGEADVFSLKERHLYAAKRLGIVTIKLADDKTESLITQYELTNHIGNVLTVITDEDNGSSNDPKVESLTDCYPFGMEMGGRNYNSNDYRFGYTGHEKESDVAEGVYTTQYRLLDTRLGRWMSVDPLFAKYPDMSSYNYCGGNPMRFWDSDGSEIVLKHYTPSPYDINEQGTFTNGMSEEGLNNLELFAKTQEGYAILSQFAKKGFKIGSVEFKEDGKYSQHQLELYDYNMTTSTAGFNAKPRWIDKGTRLKFIIAFNTQRDNKEQILVTLGHEFFIHFIKSYEKAIKVFESKDKNKKKEFLDSWAKETDDNVDHKDYTNKPNSFLNFIKYIEQVKKQKSVDKGNIDNARKNHDDKYKKWFGKKKK